MADYEHGKMDIATQQAAYESFWTWSIRTAIFCAVVLFLMYLFLT